MNFLVLIVREMRCMRYIDSLSFLGFLIFHEYYNSYLTEGTDKVVKFTGYPRHAFQKIYHQARRERGQIYPGPQVMGAPRIFLWGHSNFLDEIFLLFGQRTDINHGKNWAAKAIKAYSSGKFFPEKVVDGGGVIVWKIFFENNLPRAPDYLGGPVYHYSANFYPISIKPDRYGE